MPLRREGHDETLLVALLLHRRHAVRDVAVVLRHLLLEVRVLGLEVGERGLQAREVIVPLDPPSIPLDDVLQVDESARIARPERRGVRWRASR